MGQSCNLPAYLPSFPYTQMCSGVTPGFFCLYCMWSTRAQFLACHIYGPPNTVRSNSWVSELRSSPNVVGCRPKTKTKQTKKSFQYLLVGLEELKWCEIKLGHLYKADIRAPVPSVTPHVTICSWDWAASMTGPPGHRVMLNVQNLDTYMPSAQQRQGKREGHGKPALSPARREKWLLYLLLHPMLFLCMREWNIGQGAGGTVQQAGLAWVRPLTLPWGLKNSCQEWIWVLPDGWMKGEGRRNGRNGRRKKGKERERKRGKEEGNSEKGRKEEQTNTDTGQHDLPMPSLLLDPTWSQTQEESTS